MAKTPLEMNREELDAWVKREFQKALKTGVPFNIEALDPVKPPPDDGGYDPKNLEDSDRDYRRRELDDWTEE